MINPWPDYQMTPDTASLLYIGTMSGTSMDGLDMVAVTFDIDDRANILATHHIPYPENLRAQLHQLVTDGDATVSKMCSLDTSLGRFYAHHISQFIADNQLQENNIHAIASHGQTVRHSADGPLPYTLQIGDPNIIAALTGLVVVADFRRRDIALEGQGAPLAPAFHNRAFRSQHYNRSIINIGGIANITCLPADPSAPISGFDTGPGNTLMDYLSQQVLGTAYDNNGDFARSGKVLDSVLSTILQNETYFHQAPPKSTGTDYFSPKWLQKSGLLDTDPANAMATLVELVCITISNAIKNLPVHIHESYVCGGGAQNQYLLQRLALHLGDSRIDTTDALGIHPDWVEAVAFAWMARQTLHQQPSNHPEVTNAEKFTILGAVYY